MHSATPFTFLLKLTRIFRLKITVSLIIVVLMSGLIFYRTLIIEEAIKGIKRIGQEERLISSAVEEGGVNRHLEEEFRWDRIGRDVVLHFNIIFM